MRPLAQLLNRALELTVILLMTLLVLDVLWGVCSRLLLNRPSVWTEELATYLLMWVALLGAAVAFRRQLHLGVDYFVLKLHPDAQPIMAIAVQLMIAIFAMSVMVWGGYVLVSETFSVGQLTPALGIRMGLVYLAVPIAGLCITIFALETALETIERCLSQNKQFIQAVNKANPHSTTGKDGSHNAASDPTGL